MYQEHILDNIKSQDSLIPHSNTSEKIKSTQAQRFFTPRTHSF